MKIRSIELTNFRKFVGTVRVDGIGDNVNVLVGRNELGKSTLLEAINGVIFEKAKSMAAHVKAFRHFVNGTVAALNAKIMRRVGKSRNELLETLDRSALDALPNAAYCYAEWKRARVAPDYHIEIAGHYYSVPSKLIREIVETRITSATVEIFHKGQRVASHAFSAVRNRHTTITEHMPSAHRRYAEWTPAKMMSEAAKVGSATVALFEAIMKAKPHPEQGFRSCLGIIGLIRSYGVTRLEAASRRGNDIGATSYGSIASILKHGLDKAYATEPTPDVPPIRHGNIRGSRYYH
jgi:energy-coupling factor transporter ATP-binding protein EcfA2